MREDATIELGLKESIAAEVRTAVATVMNKTSHPALRHCGADIADEITAILIHPDNTVSSIVKARDYEMERSEAWRDDLKDSNTDRLRLEEEKSALIGAYTDRAKAWAILESAYVALAMIADHESSCTDVHSHAQIRILASTINSMLGEMRYVTEPFDVDPEGRRE